VIRPSYVLGGRAMKIIYDANTLKALFGTGGGRPQLASGKLTVPAEEAFKRLEEALQ